MIARPDTPAVAEPASQARRAAARTRALGARWRGTWLLVALAATALAIAVWPVPVLGAPGARHVQIQARSFEYTPGEIWVHTGDTITLELVSADYVHGLYVDGYELNITADPGQRATLTFVADRPGTFRLRCSVTCGPLHPFMIGKLHVGPAWGLWRAIALAGLAAVAGLLLAARPALRPADQSHGTH